MYETYIESATSRREEKYLKIVYKTEGPINGIQVSEVPERSDFRRVLITSNNRLAMFLGRLGRGHEGSGSIYHKLFESETPVVRTSIPGTGSASGCLVMTPEVPGSSVSDRAKSERIFGWQSTEGLVHGRLWDLPSAPETANMIFSDSMTLPPLTSAVPSILRSRSTANLGPFVALTQWHIVQLVDNRIVANNRLDQSVVYDQQVLDSSQQAIALLADAKQNTFWLFTTSAIYEISATEEDRDVWSIFLAMQKYDLAAQYASTLEQRDRVAAATGDALMKNGKYLEAAETYGASTKRFEQVALSFIDAGHRDALRKYLSTKLFSNPKPTSMQRTMLASWLIELYMTALNTLDDTLTTASVHSSTSAQSELSVLRAEYADFVRRAKSDLDRTTTYTLIASHGREEELVTFATVIADYNYLISYWVQRERWPSALAALTRQADQTSLYKYSAVLMCNVPAEFTDILMRTPNLNTRELIPAMLAYTTTFPSISLKDNQAVRYLLYDIATSATQCPPATHNTLISIYAAHPSQDEDALLAYLDAQTPPPALSTSAAGPDGIVAALPYDADFALRLCVQHTRIRAAVQILVAMSRFAGAVDLALRHARHELAIAVAERPEIAPQQRKSLWLAIARAVISPASPTSLASHDSSKNGAAADTAKAGGIGTALSLLRLAPPGTLRIEDILPLLPDLVLIDALKPEILSALAAYSAHIDALRADMDASAATAARVTAEHARAASRRAAVLRPGDPCVECAESLLARRFWVWACGHGAHEPCVAEAVVKRGAKGRARRVKELRGVLVRERESGAVVAGTKEKEKARAEMDEILGAECPLCGELAVRDVDRPFVSEDEAKGNEWAL